MSCRSFGLHNGWDFKVKKYRDKFMELLREHEPDHVFLAPPCGLWSQMQEINCKTQAARDSLTTRRRAHHEVHLQFVRDVYHAQVKGDRHAHVEQPSYARSWKTSNLAALGGHHVIFD